MIDRVVLIGVLSLASSLAFADEPINFAQQIQPILADHCAKCHGDAKPQGKLRLNSIAGIEAKLRAEPSLIVAGKPDESELYKRLVLPADNSKRMPKNADPLPQATIDLIAQWIQQGAVLSAALTTATPPAPAASAPTKPAEKPALPEVPAAPQAAIDKLTAAGARVTPLFAGSNLLEVSFAGKGQPAGPDDVALLSDIAEQVYTLNLADAKIESAGFAPVVNLKNLASLHLERSTVSDEALAHLSGLSQLQYLNLYGTRITDAGLAHLANLKHLSRLYLWQTKVSYEPAMALERDIPGLIVNIGFDHPEVVKRRLTSELESVKKQVEAAKVAAEKAKAQLEQAEKDAASTAARVSEIEKQLQELKTPADGN